MNYLIHNTGRNQVPGKPIPRLFPKAGEWKGEPERVEIKGIIALTSLDVTPNTGVGHVTYGVEASHVFAVGDEVECLPDKEWMTLNLNWAQYVGSKFTILPKHGPCDCGYATGHAVAISNTFANWPIRSLRLIRAANAPVETEPQEKDGWIVQPSGFKDWRKENIRVRRDNDPQRPWSACTLDGLGHSDDFFRGDDDWDSFRKWSDVKRAIKEKTKCK